MVAVGNISMLKPNTKSIPIDKNDDDTAVYLDKGFQFHIEIEGRGKLNYTVKPLTLDTEQKLVTTLNDLLKNQLYKLYLSENEDLTPKVLAMLYKHNLFSEHSIDGFIADFSTCLNPELILPELKGILKAFKADDLCRGDYQSLYEKLVEITYYKKHHFKPSALYHKMMTIRKLKRKNLDDLVYLADKVIRAYTIALLRQQEIYLKFKVLMNVVRYEREFKKKLLSLFLVDTQKMSKSHRDLDSSTLYLGQNADTTHNGNTIPVF